MKFISKGSGSKVMHSILHFISKIHYMPYIRHKMKTDKTRTENKIKVR